MTATLVQPLFDGPLDIVGDVHGEIDALRSLLQHLGYSAEGVHSEGRRLVFVGDLADRGPDSPVVLDLVRRLVESQRAQCILGNHELNILLGSRKVDNVWFFHHELSPGHAAAARPQVRIDPQARNGILDFFAELPLALERSEVRVVHACWDDEAIALARQATRADDLYHEHRARIDDSMRRRGLSDLLAKLAHQNQNPVKLLTSGPEEKADSPFTTTDGKVRHERRIAWWDDYRGPLCVFGHYSRLRLPTEPLDENNRFFASVPLDAALGRGNALCIDCSVGKRSLERAAPGTNGVFVTRLAVLRLPERMLIFDDGERMPLREKG